MENSTKFTPALIMLSGPSGAGKDTILTKLIAHTEKYQFVLTYTSRPPRGTEQDGKDYRFTNRDHFQQMIAQNQLLEWSEVYGNFYGVPKLPIKQSLADGKHAVIRVDVQGVLKIQKILPSVLTVVILTPTVASLTTRLHNRGDMQQADLKNRIQLALEEIQTFYNLSNRCLIFNYQDRTDDAVYDTEFAIRCTSNRLTAQQLQNHYRATVKILED